MLQAKLSGLKRIGKRAFRILLTAMMILQTLWIPNAALADATVFGFRGFGAENMSSDTLSYVTNDASISGRNVTIAKDAPEGETIGLVNLNETINISKSVDLGDLEISFSAISSITLEGDNGVDNDVPTIRISFCSSDDIGSEISSVTLTKNDATVAGNEKLSSGAGIPKGTRSIFVSLKGTSKSGDNTVAFSDVSLSIRDGSAPSCTASYSQDWTNQDVSVTINASDSDAGLEGIYMNGLLVSETSPYVFTASENGTSFSAYAMDLAGKQSEIVEGTINNIDKSTPAAPSSVPLSSSTWTNADVSVLMPALGAASGSPERYVYQIGTDAWKDLADFVITTEGSTTIHVAVQDAAGNRSASAQATAKIDKSAPTIGNAVITSGSSSARIDVSATEVGSSGLQKFCYAPGELTEDYFTTGGTTITGSTFTVSSGGWYTIFASDYAGNTALKKIEVTTAPTFDAIEDIEINEDADTIVPLSISDAESALSELTISVSVSDDELLQEVALVRTETEASLEIKPIANLSGGPSTITVTVEDPSGQVVSRSFKVTVLAVNDNPVAKEDSATLDEDSRIEIDVLSNDNDTADGDTISISDVGTATNGTTLLVLGKIRYTPNENFAGSDSFQYSISDGNGGVASTEVTITVNQVNDAPTAVDDVAAMAEDSSINIDVLNNDTDIDKETNTAEVISLDSCTDGANGTAQIVEGLIEYKPDADFNGTDEFTYTIRDVAGLTSEARVTVTVAPEADAPSFKNLETEYTIDEDAIKREIAFEINDVETPQDSLMLQAASLDTELLDQTGVEITGLGDKDAAVQLLLTPVKNANGDVNVILTLGDGFETVEQTITIHITNVNDAPTAGSDTRTYEEDAEYVDLSIESLLAKHSDIDHDPITFDGLDTSPAVGSIELIDDGTTIRYTPQKDYDGTCSFTYYITDGIARTLATCTLEAIGSNDTPTITVEPTQIDGTEDQTIVIPFRISDNESAPSDLSIIVASSDDNVVTTEGIQIVKNADGSGEVRILPAADTNGKVNVTVTVSDGEAQASDSVDLLIAPTQDAPIAEEDLVYVQYTSRRTFSPLENDHDVDGDVLSIIPPEEVTLPGKLTFDEATQTFTYMPAIGENGVKTFSYTITDGIDEASALVTLDVTSEAHAPVITAIDSHYVVEDETVSGITFNVSDEDFGDTARITVSSGDATLLPEDAEHIIVTPGEGGDYSLALKPAVDQSGSTSVTVTVTDSTDLTDSTTFNLYVMGQNDAPVAYDDAYTMNEDGAQLLKLVDNDKDADGDTIWLSSLSQAAHGYVERVGNDYTYYPYGDWSGEETLTYRVSDGRATDEGSVTITVNPVNDAPVAWSDWQTLRNDTGSESVNIDVDSNDYDVDHDAIHVVEIVAPPKYGTATIQANGTITYTRTRVSPDPNGADTFSYRIIDRASDDVEGCQSATGFVYIGVEFHSALNTYGKNVSCFEDDDPFTIDLGINNPNGIEYTLSIGTTTLGAFEVLDNKTVRFSPATDQHGYAAITYTIEKVGGGEKDTGIIWLRVYPVNDLPEITSAPTSITMNEDTSGGYSFNVDFRDGDCSNDYLYFYVYTQSATTSAPIPFMASYSTTNTPGGKQVTIRTAENVNGTGEIVVGVSDGMTYVQKVIDLTVTPVDDAPRVNNVARIIREDSIVTFASPGSDSEVDGETVVETIDPAHAPQHGKATINANRTITYVPDDDFFGDEVFNVIVTDQTANKLSATGTVTIKVNPVNDQPEIFDLDYYQSTLEDHAKDVTLTVRDVDNDLTASTHYTLTSADQKLVKNENITISNVAGTEMVIHVVPEPNMYGTVKINILASDGKLAAKDAFSLKIISVNDLPEAKDDTAVVDENVSTGAEAKPPKTITTINLIGNDVDVEDVRPRVVAISNIPAGITVANVGDGTVRVSADGDFSGDVEFDYTVMDRAGATDSAHVTLTIRPINDPPRAKNNSLTIYEDDTPLIDVLQNDTDPEGDALTIKSVGTTSHGTAEINGTKVLYTPVANYFGTDSFEYTVSDGNDGEATATVYLTIKPVNDAPTVTKHSSNAGDWEMYEDVPKSFNFVVADAESPTNNLIIKITSDDQALVKNTQIALSTDAAGYKTIRVTPVANASGKLNLTFRVSDGLAAAEIVVPLTIISVNDAPVVTAPAQTTKEDTKLTASATATDADGDKLTFSASTQPKHGTVTVREDGSYDYQPAPNYNGEDSFVICVDDGQESNRYGYATVYITVKPDGDAPIANDDEATLDEDVATKIPVLANDSDEDVVYGDEITILRVTKPAHGTAVIDGGEILYTPAADYNGTDSFGYTISDKDGKLASAQVSITIDPVNDKPRGGDDTATVLEDHSVVIEVTLNDDVDETTNPDMEDVTIDSVDVPAHGTASYSEDRKTITYTPNADWFSAKDEPELFYYTAKDSSGEMERFAVRVTVTSVNDLPVITPETLPDVTTLEDTRTEAITFKVSDIETPAGELTVTATHLNGVLLPAITVTRDADGNCTFTVLPNGDKVGNTDITVHVRDKDGGEDSAKFKLTVTPVNDLPKRGDDVFTVAEDKTHTADVLANDDVDTLANNGGDILKLLTVTDPTYGKATIKDNQIFYEPKADRDTTVAYTDVFTYTMEDSFNNECTMTVTATVTPVNDAPTISPISDVAAFDEDAPNGTGDVAFNVTDEEDDDDTLIVSAACDNTTLIPLSNISITNPTGDELGTLRTVKAIPAANQFGTALITLTVRDHEGRTAESSFLVTVNSVNDEPNNGNRTFTVVEDVEGNLDVLDDIDPDYATTPDYITITGIAENPSHGTVRVAEDKKSIYYTTALNSNEPDSFKYTIYDGYGKASYTFTASIEVTPVNDAPEVHYSGPAEYHINEATQKNDIPFTVTDVDNVTFAGGKDEVEVTLSARSSNTILLTRGINIDTLTGDDRNIDLKPYLKWNGRTTVTITATDPDGSTGSASFVLIVDSVNDTPVAVDDSFTIPEDETSSVDVLQNDTDADLQTNPDTEYKRVKTVNDTDDNATITKSEDSLSVIVIPKANYNGPVSFTYTLEDSQHAESNVATVNLTVSQVNDTPVPAEDTAYTDEEKAVVIDVLNNDTDVDNVSGINAHPEDETLSIVLTGGGLKAPSNGKITSDGLKITYTPKLNYNGPDSFEYYCSDGEKAVKAIVKVTVYQVNDPPVAGPNSETMTEDKGPLTVDVVANDYDVDTGTALNKNVLHYRSEFSILTATLSNNDHGTVEIIQYTLSDGHDDTASSTLTVTVDPDNDLPVYDTAPENLDLTEDEGDGVIQIAVNDVETLKDDLAVTVTKSSNPTLIDLADVTIEAGANGIRTITVNPKNDQNGTAIIELTLDDGDGGITTAEFTVTVAAVNDDPIAESQDITIDEDAPLQTYQKSAIASDVDIDTNEDAITLTIATAAAHGTAGIDADGNVTYIPNADFNGTDSFTFTATDSAKASHTGTFNITINQVNDAPVALDDEATTNEDTAVLIDVLKYDSDVDMDASLNASPEDESIGVVIDEEGLLAPSHGDITTDGLKITYTPDDNFNGEDTFEYYCSDGEKLTKATVTVTVTAVNDDPIADDKTLVIDEDAALMTFAKTTLTRDVDIDTNEDALTLAITTQAQHGTAGIDGDGNVTYIPNADFNGTDSFVYTAKDKAEAPDTGTFSITINQVNDAPKPAEDAMTTKEEVAVDIFVLTNDDDIDQDETLNASPKAEVLSVVLDADGLIQPLHGEIATDGEKITYTPDTNYNGEDTFEYYCSDGETMTKTAVTVTTTQVNDTPVGTPDEVTIDEGSETDYIAVLTNDTDVDLDETLNLGTLHSRNTFKITSAEVVGDPCGAVDVVDNKVKFTPYTDWNGVAVISYTFEDGYGLSATTELRVTVKSINDLPVFETEPEDMNLTEDGDSGETSVVLSDIETTAALLKLTVTESSNSTLVDTSDVVITGTGATRTITVNPKNDQNGTATITLSVEDEDGGITTVQFTVTVAAVNDDPIADDKTLVIDEDAALMTFAKTTLTRDVDIDTNEDVLTLTITTQAQHGTAGIDKDGNVTYIPDADFNGNDSFVYTATDKAESPDIGTFSITINQVNDAPVALDDEATTAEDTAVVIDVLKYDSDVDMDVNLNASPEDESIGIVIDEDGLLAPSHGDITTDGLKITYTPDTNFNGEDTFEYYCSDGEKLTKATVTVTVTAVNDDPIADDKTLVIDEDAELMTFAKTTLTRDVDIDTNEDVLTLTITTQAQHGTAGIDKDGNVTYIPNADFNGTDSFVYTATDKAGSPDIGTFSITINQVNDAPVALDDEATTAEDTAVVIDVLKYDSDVDMDVNLNASPEDESIGIVIDGEGLLAPSHGDITTDGLKITYTPDDNFNGEDTFEYYCSDGEKLTKATVTVTVTAVNDDPIADDKTLVIDEDAELMTFAKTTLTRDVDIDTNEDVLTLTITTQAQHGTAGIDKDGNVTYIPNADFNGTDSFVYTATDKAESPDIGTFSITINQVNDAPVALDDEATTAEDTAVVIDVLKYDSDVDMDVNLNASPEDESIGIVIGEDGLLAPSHGDITTDGLKITYTPDDNFNGEDTFEYYCSDGETMTRAAVTVKITQVNDSPNAKPDETTTQEDTPTGWIDVMANDTDVDLGAELNQDLRLLREKFNVKWVDVTDDSTGTAELVGNMVRFTPAKNWFGTAYVQYSLDDGYGNSCITSLTVNVEAENDPPEYPTPPTDLELAEDGASGIVGIVVSDPETPARDLVVTVTETDNPTLIDLSDVTIVSGANGIRTITVNPKDNQNGTAVITLTVEDEEGLKTTAKFTVTVAAVNNDPIALDKILEIDEDAELMTFDKTLLTSDVDIDTNEDVLTLTITTQAQHGTAGIDKDGNVTYIPDADFNGTDSFVYTATDLAKAPDSGTFSITINQVNDAPVALDDEATTKEEKAVVIDVLKYDSDVDMDVNLNASPEDESIGIVIGTEGLVTPLHGDITTDGETITYTPDDNFNGTDTFDYYCSDGPENIKATVKVTITQVNDNPVANDDSATTKEDTPVRWNVLENDTDVDTLETINLGELHSKDDFSIDSVTLYGGEHGTAQIDGAFIRFTPDADFYGTQLIKYVLKDSHNGESTGTLTILVGSEADAPDAKDDSMSAEEDNTAFVNVLANDTDRDPGDTKKFIGFTKLPAVLEGRFETSENGDVSFIPNANYNGTFEATYQVEDSDGLIGSAKLTVTITPVNDVPVANDSLVETDEDNSKDIDVSSLISDADVETNEDVIQVSVAKAGEPAHGAMSVSGNVITYTPDSDFNGADEITYTVTDSYGKSDTGKLTITVRPVNDAPVALDDEKTIVEDSAPDILVLVNDTDIDTDDSLNLEPAAAPYILHVGDGAHGTATTDGSVIVYTPNANFNGTDTITYQLTDGIETVEANVAITITQVNDGIHAVDDADDTNDEDPITVDVLDNDWDVDTDADLNKDELHLRDSFRITAVGEPENGTASIVSGKIEYRPEDRFAGKDSFTYTITDGHGTTASAVVTITVHSVNDPPVILAVASPKDGDRAGTGSKVMVEWTSFDIDGDALTYRLEYYDGKDWLLISNDLTSTSYLFAIPDSLPSTDGLKFRVNVRDSEFTSEYGYSGAMKVDKDAPTGTVVIMKTADGKTYTEGVWTNQTVTVIASNAVDDSNVVYYYGMDAKVSLLSSGAGEKTRIAGILPLDSKSAAVSSGSPKPADSMDVVAGVHHVHITAVDEYGNATYVGAYLARVDKQQPAVPDIRESISGANVQLTLTFLADPGNSGNNRLTLPDGTVVRATDNPTYLVAKNGSYNFLLTDIAGNSKAFTHTVTTADTSKPIITLDAGDYRIGSTTQSSIRAALTFTDAESDIVNRGYSITSGSTPSGAYRTYDGALTLSDPGTYYIHAYAKNAFGLTAYETFGPFIIEAVPVAPGAATPAPTPVPETGDVVVHKKDVDGIPDDTVSIRLPGQEWSDTLTLENVGPGTYLIEVMDKDGNIRTVEVKVTMRDIIARSLRSSADKATVIAAASLALAGLLILFLLAGHNIIVVVNGSEKKLRTLRRLRFRKQELIIPLNDKQLSGGRICTLKIAKSLIKRMRGNTVVLTMRGVEVLREQIPEDMNEAFERTIAIAD